MPSISSMSSSSVSSLSIGTERPGPDIASVPDSSDSSISVVEGIGSELLVLGRTSIIAAEGEGRAVVLEGETSLMSEVSISTPS